jgi:hypothetical protein
VEFDLESRSGTCGTVALGGFVRLAQATAISPDEGDSPQGSKG